MEDGGARAWVWFAALVWLGLTYFTADDADEDDGPMVMLCAWEAGRARPLTIAAPSGAVAQMVRMLRDAGGGTSLALPRCDACGTTFDLPLD